LHIWRFPLPEKHSVSCHSLSLVVPPYPRFRFPVPSESPAERSAMRAPQLFSPSRLTLAVARFLDGAEYPFSPVSISATQTAASQDILSFQLYPPGVKHRYPPRPSMAPLFLYLFTDLFKWNACSPLREVLLVGESPPCLSLGVVPALPAFIWLNFRSSRMDQPTLTVPSVPQPVWTDGLSTAFFSGFRRSIL